MDRITPKDFLAMTIGSRKMDNCMICKDTINFQWTDLHGEAICTRCGIPYQVIQYDEERMRIDAEPRIKINQEYILLAQRYWQEERKPTGLGFYIDDRYQDQEEAFLDWVHVQPEMVNG